MVEILQFRILTFASPTEAELLKYPFATQLILQLLHIIVVMVLIAECNALYHPEFRQDVFIKDEFHYLNVPRVGTYIVHGMFYCTFECLNNPSCLSLNLAASQQADGKLWCELLSYEKYSKPEKYKRNDSSHHFSIKVI